MEFPEAVLTVENFPQEVNLTLNQVIKLYMHLEIQKYEAV